MAKYIFVTNFEGVSPAPDCARSTPPCPYMPFRQSFKKGDVVEGTMIVNNLNSEPPNFIVVNGGIQVPFGGRGSQIIQAYSTTGNAIPIGQDNRGNSSKFVWTPTKKVFAGLLAIGAILGILKLTKAI